MLEDTAILIKDPAWGTYNIQVIGINTEQECFQVLNDKGEKVNVEWATYDGAATCAELLAEGYLKE